MAFQPKLRPVVLCVLDGWGWRPEEADNAIARADTPVFDRMLRECPHALIRTCGTDVGLPAGQMGNSEVGHLNLGAGRVVDQDIRRIDAVIENGTMARIPALAGFIDRLKTSGGTCHLMGLVSPGGVHSHQDQIVALARVVSEAAVPVAVHAFLDGRDTPPRSAERYMHRFLDDLARLTGVVVVTVCGRYYAMDRDKRWDRVARAYSAIVSAEGERTADPASAIRQSYAAGTGDEFVLPTVIGDYAGMADGDGVLMGNFRADRAREIMMALLDPDFDGFERERTISIAAAAGMVEYSAPLARRMTALFPPVELNDILGEVVAAAGLKQLRIAETEKYAHVTFFFNGGIETPFNGEDRVLIASPKVATYDLKPEMSAVEVTDRLVEAVGSGVYDFILVNYANPDMVGHTGIMAAAVRAIETVDRCLGRLSEAVSAAGGALLITADHGNAETMVDPDTGEPFTSHTTNPVPAILVNAPAGVTGLEEGQLSDIAPTILDLIGLRRPAAMTGHSLLCGPTQGKEGTARERASATA